MAVTSGFFNSLYGDRKYTAEQFSALFNGLINDGVFSNIGTAFRVSATTDNNITIGIGRAWFNGIWVNNDALLPMTCNDPEVLLDRIDAVVIEINRSEAVRAGRIIFVKGTASGTPVNPILIHDESIDQYPLAYIRRKAGVSAVVQADITNCIGTSECPYVTGILETQNIDNVVAQWESQFNIWFDGLQVELEGDVAANLASQVIDLNMRFNELAETRTVTVELQDSSLDTIEDSTGNAILGSTVLGESEGSETNIVPVQTEGSYKVGDIQMTARTGLGMNWLLCNGAEVSRSDYPELSPLLPFDNIKGPFKDDVISSETININDTPCVSSDCMYGIDYLNDYYIAWGSRNKTDAIIAYKKNLEDEWTIKVIWSSNQYGFAIITKVIYVDGQYVAVGACANDRAGGTSNSVTQYARLAYTTDISSSWTTKDIWSRTSTSTLYENTVINDILYRDGRFIVVGSDYYNSDSNYARMFYATTLSGTWTQIYEYIVENGLGFTRIIYANDYYIVIGGSPQNGNSVLCYCSGSSNPTNSSNWTKYTTHMYLGDNSIYDILYADGYYYMLSRDVIFYSSTLEDFNDNGFVPELRIPENSIGFEVYLSNILDQFPYYPYPKMLYHDGKIYVTGLSQSVSESSGETVYSMAYAVVENAPDLETIKWSFIKVGDEYLTDVNSRCKLMSIQFINDSVFFTGTTESGDRDYERKSHVMYENPSVMLLPEITPDGAYAYIKAGGD